MKREKKNQSIKTDPDVKNYQEKDIKTVIILVFHMFKNLGRDMEDIKRTQIEILEKNPKLKFQR